MMDTKISELISWLQDAKSTFGDLPVKVSINTQQFGKPKCVGTLSFWNNSEGKKDYLVISESDPEELLTYE